MATLIIETTHAGNPENIMAAVRQLKGVKTVSIQPEETFKRIPGLAYTREERIASLQRAEESIRAGRTITSEELKQKMQTW